MFVLPVAIKEDNSVPIVEKSNNSENIKCYKCGKILGIIRSKHQMNQIEQRYKDRIEKLISEKDKLYHEVTILRGLITKNDRRSRSRSPPRRRRSRSPPRRVPMGFTISKKPKITIKCRFFESGFCKKGDACDFMHIPKF